MSLMQTTSAPKPDESQNANKESSSVPAGGLDLLGLDFGQSAPTQAKAGDDDDDDDDFGDFEDF